MDGSEQGNKNPETTQENPDGDIGGKNKGGRPVGSFKDKSIEGRMKALLEPAMSYLEDLVLDKEGARPNAVKLNACRGVIVWETNRERDIRHASDQLEKEKVRKQTKEKKEEEKQKPVLGKVGTEYDEAVKKIHQEGR